MYADTILSLTVATSSVFMIAIIAAGESGEVAKLTYGEHTYMQICRAIVWFT